MDELDSFLTGYEEEKRQRENPQEDPYQDLDTFLEQENNSPYGDLDSFLDEGSAPKGVEATPVPEAGRGTTITPEPKETPAPPKGKTYSANDLVLDEYFHPIKDYMVERYGVHMKDMKRQEIVDKYLNNMRGFAGGNTIRSVSEISFLNQAGDKPEAMEKISRAYEIYEGMENLYSGETTFGEKVGGTVDFLRTAVFDPVNLIGFGLAKTATSSGFKVASHAAKVAARKTFKAQMAKGVGKEVALKAAEKTFNGLAKQTAAQVAKKQASRQAVRNGVKRGLTARILNKEAVKEIAVMGSFDGAVAASTDYLYQDAMLRTKVQDEYNIYQTGLNAIASMVFMGGVAAGGAGLKGLSKIVKPGAKVKTGTSGAKLTDLSPEIGKMMRVGQKIDSGSVPTHGEYGSWDFKVKAGKELQDQDFEFFTTMLLGNDKLGLKGLGTIFQEQGYVWRERTPDDKVSNWIADIIKESDPQDAQKFMDDFIEATGISMAEGKELTPEKLADVFAKKMSDSMRLGNAASQLARQLGVKESQVTFDDYANFMLFGRSSTDEIEPTLMSKAAKFKPEWMDDVNIRSIQNGYIRLLVSNMSTSFLNVTGYAAASTLNSASDLAMAALHVPGALIGKQGSADTIKAIAKNQRWKLMNTLDANMTYDRFIQYVNMRPKAMKELYRILPGGVEDVKKLASEGFDPDATMLSIRSNQIIDGIQSLHLVQAQDSITKSIEFTTQMDRILRLPESKGGLNVKGGWNEFFARDDYIKLMNSEAFANAEAKAIEESLSSIYSKSYKGQDWLGEIAGVIEDARNVPIVGTMVPFGRFFNNTVALMADSTVVWPLLRKSGYLVGKGSSTRTKGEILTRGAVMWGGIFALSEYEKYNKDNGLGPFEEIDPMTGAVKDERYEFPYAFWKFMGRIVAHARDGDEIPPELRGQAFDQFIGQFTRQLGEAGVGMREFFIQISEGNVDALESLKAVGSNFVAGSSRFMDPANQLVGVVRGDKNYVADNKQGKKALNDTFRYIDNFLDMVNLKERPPEKYSATRGDDLRPQTTKVFSTVRETRLTHTSQMMANLGMPDWDKFISQYSDTPEADNRFNQVFHNLVERGAESLLETDQWKKGDLETKKYLASDLVTKARKGTRSYMERLGGIEDNELLLMIKIREKNDRVVNNIMEDIGYEDKKLEDLSYEELLNLQNALEFREEFKVQ